MPWITTNASKTSFYVRDKSVDPSTGQRTNVHLGTYDTKSEAQRRVEELADLKKNRVGGLEFAKGKLPFRDYFEKYQHLCAETHKGYQASEKYVFSAMLRDLDESVIDFKDKQLNYAKAEDIAKWSKLCLDGGMLPAVLKRKLSLLGFMLKPLDTIHSDDIEAWVEARQAEGIAESTITRQLTIIKSTFAACKKNWRMSWLTVNPATLDRDDGDNPRTRRINATERRKLLMAASSHRKAYFPLVIEFALETAARQAEIANARIENYDAEHKTILFLDTKNGTDRMIGLTNRAAEIIEIALVKCKNTDGLVFGTTDKAIKESWKDHITEEKGFFDLHFHDTRHERTSQMFEEGRMSTEQIKSFTGHKDNRSIERYLHLCARHTGKIMRGEMVMTEA